MKKTIIIFVGLLILGTGVFLLCEFFWQKNNNSPVTVITDNNQTDDNNSPTTEQPLINNFSDCVAEGNPVMESYPRQCTSKAGVHFIEEIGNELALIDKIRIDNPRPNQMISSPLTITGQARGTWFFEASFPVVLTDWDGLIIAEGIATAKSDWMTEDFVPFEATLTFNTPTYKNNGNLILKRDNPSGLPEYDEALEIPIFFDMK